MRTNLKKAILLLTVAMLLPAQGIDYAKAEEEPVQTYATERSSSEMHFDMSEKSTMYHGSTGFLYGVAEINVPSIDLLYGLKPAVLVQKAYNGLQHPTGDSVRTSSAIKAAGGKSIQVYFQDIYLEWPYNAPYKDDGSLDVDGYQKAVEEILYGTICDKASADDPNAFLGSDGNYYTLNEEKAQMYSYVLFNEPDNIWYGNNLSGLENAWKQIYDAVHAIDPNAKCVGPNFSSFNAGSYDSFLSYCYDNNCLPELISWHELGDNSLTNYYSNYDTIKGYADKYYTDEYTQKSGREITPELIVNEYARYYDIGAPGGLVKWLSMFEDKDMNGCMAYWGMANSLNEMAAKQNSPNSTWWVYHWYAQMTGEQCAHTSPDFASSNFYGTVSYDEDINMAYALFGGAQSSNETVYLDNLDKTSLVGEHGAVNVKVYGVGYSGQMGTTYKPECVYDGAVNVTDNTLKIHIENTDEMDVYFAVITKTDEEGTDMSGAAMSVISYEAENAELIGGAKTYSKKAWGDLATSGRSIVGSINNNGDGVKFTVDVPEDGTYNMSLFYSLQAPYVNAQSFEPDANGQNRAIGQVLPFGMSIDGGENETIYLDTTVKWDYKTHHDIDLELTKGEHTITFTQINGDEGNKGNLQLVACVDKIDLTHIEDENTRNDFTIDMDEQTAFIENGSAKITAVAPVSGYYDISGDGDFTLKKQVVDYAADAESYSEADVYDVDVENTVYLSQGANTLTVTGDVSELKFDYISDETHTSVIKADEMNIRGYNAYYKDNSYADGGKVITELGIGQNVIEGEEAKDNYIEFKVNAESEGMYNFAVKYANDEPAPVMKKTDGSNYVHPYNIDLVERYAQFSVNDGEPETVYFRNTLSWDTFETMDVQLHLNEGENTIKIYNDNSYQFSSIVNSTAPEIASISITPLSYSGSAVTFAAPDTNVDTSFIDTLLAQANEKLINEDDYTEKSITGLKTAVESVDKSTQSATNISYSSLKTAMQALRLKTDMPEDIDEKFENAGSGSLMHVAKTATTPYTQIKGITLYIGNRPGGDDWSTNWSVEDGGVTGKALVMNSGSFVSSSRGPRMQINEVDIPDGGYTQADMKIKISSGGVLNYNDSTSTDTNTVLGGLIADGSSWNNVSVKIIRDGVYTRTIYVNGVEVLSDHESTFPVFWGTTSNGSGQKIYFDDVSVKTYLTYQDHNDQTGITFENNSVVYIRGDFEGTLNAYLAEYDENGILSHVYMSEMNDDTPEMSISVPDDSDNSFKAYLWDDNMNPVCDVEILEK